MNLLKYLHVIIVLRCTHEHDNVCVCVCMHVRCVHCVCITQTRQQTIEVESIKFKKRFS